MECIPNVVISFYTSAFSYIRRNTQIAQKLQENYVDNIQEFLSYSIKLRNKNNYKLCAMASMDGIPIYNSIRIE